MRPGHAGKVAGVIVDTPIALSFTHDGDDVMGIEQALVDQRLNTAQVRWTFAQNSVNVDDLMCSSHGFIPQQQVKNRPQKSSW
jgi:hypothetical protein